MNKHLSTVLKWTVVTVGLMASGTAVAQTNFEYARSYILPMPEQMVFDAAKDIHNGVKAPVRARTQIVPSVTNTIIYFDHWEDGYENNLFAPTQSTSYVWGDGNLTNGVAPGHTNDTLRPGAVITLYNEVELPRDPSVTLYDARDRVGATLPISVVRELNAKDPGEALSGAVAVYPTEMFGFRFVAPVGTNTDAATTMFQVSTMIVMAEEDTTLVEIDADNNGVADRTELINRGESLSITNMRAGGSVQSTRPMQGYFITGAKSASYQMRWFTLLPDNLWGTEHFTPVGTTGGRQARVYLHNPNSSLINVRINTLVGSAGINVAAGTTVAFNMPANTGARFATTNGMKFVAVEIFDYGSHAYDWSHTIFPSSFLTEQAVISWGPGSADVARNGNAIWVTPVSNTTVYVDYDGDPNTGALIDPVGNQYDFSTNVVMYGTHRIYDNNDNDQTSMRLYTLDGVDIASVWGQDPTVTSAGNPYLDMGYAILPVPLLIPAKSSVMFTDINGDTLVSPGDLLTYTVRVTRIGVPDTNMVYLFDTMSSNLTYLTNSTVLNGTNIADNIVPPAATVFPLDEGGLNVGSVNVGASAIVSYQAYINNPFPSNVAGVVNIARSGGQEFVHFTPVNRGSIVAGSVRSDRLGLGNIYDPGNVGLPGVTVRLFTDPNGDGNPADGIPQFTNVTGSAGNFFFQVPPNNYVLVETDPATYFSSADSSAPNDNRIPISVVTDVDSVGHIFLDALSGLAISKTATPPGIWFPDLVATYHVQISNTGVVENTLINVIDPILGGQTYITNSAVILYDTFITNFVLDTFASNNFNSNFGNENWAGPWVEIDCSGAGTGAGQIRIVGGELRLNGNLTGCASGSGTNVATISRNADLFGYYSSTLTFNYRTTGVETGDIMFVQVSTNSTEWTDLGRFAGTTSGVYTQDITPFASSGGTWIRFVNQTNTYRDSDDFFFVDNVRISSREVTSIPWAGLPPPNILTNATLFPGGNIDIYFDVRISNGFNNVTNRACVTSDIVSNSICATLIKSVDTSAVPDRIGARLVNDLDGDGVVDSNERGIRTAPILLFSDPNGDGNPADGVQLNSRNTDFEGYVLFGGLGTGRYVLVQNDLSGFASTGDSSPPNNGWIPVFLPGGVDSLTNVFLDWAISGLDVQKTSSEQYDLIPNQDVTYTITVTNTRIAAQGDIRIEDTFLNDMTYVPGSARIIFTKLIETNYVSDHLPAAAYTNSNGDYNWVGNWFESNDDTLPFGGDVKVVTDMNTNRFVISDDGKGIIRALPSLTDYHTAIVSFDYRRASLEDDEYLSVLISTNTSAGPWNEIGRVGHSGLGFTTDLFYRGTNFNFSSYISATNYIQFATPTGGMSVGDSIFFDNVHIDLIKGGTVTQVCNPPPVMLDDYEIQAFESIRIVFDATAGFDDTAINQVRVTAASDPAGLYSIASNGVSAAILTQGVIAVDGYSKLSWIPATNGAGVVIKGYDLIHSDSMNGMDAELSNSWEYIATYTNSTGNDLNLLTNAGNRMRFYRVSFPNRWTPDRNPRYGSAELFVGKALTLKPGENWVSLFMIPQTNTLAGVFGLNRLPAGPDIATATRIEWVNATPEAIPTNIVWLSDSGNWMYSEGGIANNMPLPMLQGFNIILPPGSGTNYLPVIGRVPTTNDNVLAGPPRITVKAGKAYNVVSYPLPYRASLSEIGLKEAGFRGIQTGQSFNPRFSDEIRILSRGGGGMQSPVYRILRNSSGQFQYWSGGSGSAENHRIEVDDAIIIFTTVSTNDYNWDINIPYQMPNNFMSP